MEAIAGDIPEPGEELAVIEREDGSLLIDGMMPAEEAFERLGIVEEPKTGDFNTLAGFVIFGWAHSSHGGQRGSSWLALSGSRMDGRRVDKILAQPLA